jgi:hypothetical protein
MTQERFAAAKARHRRLRHYRAGGRAARRQGHSNAAVVSRSNLTDARQIRGNISANPWLPQHPSPSGIRREKAGSCRMKKTRRSFAFGSSQRNRMTLMFGAARFWRPRLKRLMQLRISHHTARHACRAASPHAAQVLQATMDFGA